MEQALSIACAHLGNCLIMYEEEFIIPAASNTLKNIAAFFVLLKMLLLWQSYRNRKQINLQEDLGRELELF